MLLGEQCESGKIVKTSKTMISSTSGRKITALVMLFVLLVSVGFSFVLLFCEQDENRRLVPT